MTIPRRFYVAYFNILGCRCFFNQNPDKAKDLLEDIHAAFDTVTNIIECVQHATLESSNASSNSTNSNAATNAIPKLKAYRKVFSDQILMCFEKTEDAFFDLNNLLAMASIAADIQREFILKYGISLRGCISQGEFSVDEDFAFGRDLIETTSFDGLNRMPRIIFTPQILHELSTNRTSLTTHELGWFYDRWLDELLFSDQDDRTVLNYLYNIDNTILERTPFFTQVATMIENRTSKTDVSKSKCHYDLKDVMNEHLKVIEGKLAEYGCYDRFGKDQTQIVQRRSAVFQKYLWTAQFHNAICRKNGLDGSFMIDDSTSTDERFGIPCKRTWEYAECTVGA